MASILDRYGIKEVADVTFYELNSAGKPTNPVLYLDTLKVSTIEQTAENTEARGGKGNAALISWDYNKEINVTLEDALFSPKSMAIMFGDGKVKDLEEYSSAKLIMKTEKFTATNAMASADYSNAINQYNSSESTDHTAGTSAFKAIGWGDKYETPTGGTVSKINPKFFDENGSAVNAFSNGYTYFCTYDLKLSDVKVIEVSANSFPGTYYITGDTFARNEASGKDEFFQFIIPRAKITSENTITLEAEGDPSVFNMNLRVLRPEDGKMMKLVKYSLADESTTTEATTAEVIHNHQLGTRG